VSNGMALRSTEDSGCRCPLLRQFELDSHRPTSGAGGGPQPWKRNRGRKPAKVWQHTKAIARRSVRRATVIGVIVGMLLAVPIGVFANVRFGDVSNVIHFHADMAAVVTAGSPPGAMPARRATVPIVPSPEARWPHS